MELDRLDMKRCRGCRSAVNIEVGQYFCRHELHQQDEHTRDESIKGQIVFLGMMRSGRWVKFHTVQGQAKAEDFVGHCRFS